MSHIKEVKIADRTITFEFNKFAKQANGSVMVTCGATQVLVTACAAPKPQPGVDFFPLGVDYIEKMYAGGRIPGGYLKREGRPSDAETLTARVIDRPLRPSFPKDYRNDTTIACQVVSYEEGVDPAPLALMGASAALMVSNIPFNGPVAALRIGLKDGEYILDPSDESDLDLNIACRPDAVLMVEAGANFLTEEQMLDAINHAHELMAPLFEMQIEVQKEIGKEKWTVEKKEHDPELVAKVADLASSDVAAGFAITDKLKRYEALETALEKTMTTLNPDQEDELTGNIKAVFADLKSDIMRGQVIKAKKRIDGRTPTDIRPIACETKILKRAHGSSLFTRGETQALGSCTLGSGDDERRMDGLQTKGMTERFMLHYNFPAFSVGEARMMRSAGRREIGHGALARRALVPVIPSVEDFGYTIRLVSETLESNGSSSMAAVCSGTMSMLDAGVPLKTPVAGIAMGLVKEGDEYTILSDILGDEDHLGDMDFKVCGSSEGITALQMDIKIGGLSKELLSEALNQAKEGRIHILGKMAEAITEPGELSEHAPRIFNLKISTDKIRDVIGPGGKNIKKIIADTGVKIDIADNGVINLIAVDSTAAEAAKSMIRASIATPEPGQIYLGKAVRVVDFGVFVELRPGMEGLCHISQLEEGRVAKVSDVVKEGEEVMVKVIDIDKQGRVKLSRKDALGQKPNV